MQSLSPEDIDARTPKRKISKETIFFLLLMIGFETWFIYRHEWVQSVIYGIFIVLYVIRAIWVYRINSRTMKLVQTLKAMEGVLKEIKNTPVLREEGNSIIFTWRCPSSKLMKEVEKFKNGY